MAYLVQISFLRQFQNDKAAEDGQFAGEKELLITTLQRLMPASVAAPANVSVETVGAGLPLPAPSVTGEAAGAATAATAAVDVNGGVDVGAACQ